MAKVSQTTIADLERGRNDTSRKLTAIASALGVSAEQLERIGSEALLAIQSGGRHEARENDTDAGPAPTDDEYALIPQFSAKAACGSGYLNGHTEVRGGLAFKRDWLQKMGLKVGSLTVIGADGDSMSPTIQPGEVLLLDHAQVTPRDGQIFALERDGELLVKRLVKDFSGAWIVRSDNADKTRYPDFTVGTEALRILARVVWRGGGL